MRRTSVFGLLFLLLVYSGCNNSYTVKTKINADGSFEKTVICEGDSLGLYKLPLPFVFSSGWKIDIHRKTDGEKNFITTATKIYMNAEELQAEYTKGKDSSKLKISSQIEKRFRWFFTYYTYQEKIPAFGLFKRVVPMDSFFTPSEIERLKNKKDTLLDKRFEEYKDQNIVEEFIEKLIVTSQKLNDPALAPSRWQEKRKFLRESLLNDNDGKPTDIIKMIEKTLRTPSVWKLREAIDTSFSEVIAKWEVENRMDVPYKNEVVMPGVLITSNAKTVEGSKLMWDCKPHQYFDVVMTAESRVVNLWAIIITAIVCLTLLAGLLLPLIKVRKRIV